MDRKTLARAKLFFTTGILWIHWTIMACQPKTPIWTEAQRDSLQRHYTQKLQTQIIKNKALASQVQISQEGIRLFASAPKSEKDSAEFFLSWEEVPAYQQWLQHAPEATEQAYPKRPSGTLPSPRFFPPPSANLPLRGWRIALDPGHIAGDMAMAQMEGKYLKIKMPDGKTVAVFESELNWFTARLLADALMQDGAEVLLTRSAFELTALDIPYQEWWATYRDSLQKAGQNLAGLTAQKTFFETFQKQDFEARVRKINAFAPHLTLIIHYNVDAANQPWQKPTQKQESMAFVGGSFEAGELQKPEARFHLLRLLLTAHLSESIEICQAVLTNLEANLQIKPVREPHQQDFLRQHALPTSAPGVYHRNLTLARRVYGPLAYLEPLYQDHPAALAQWQHRQLDYKGQKIPSLLAEVAQAYHKAIRDWVQKKAVSRP